MMRETDSMRHALQSKENERPNIFNAYSARRGTPVLRISNFNFQLLNVYDAFAGINIIALDEKLTRSLQSVWNAKEYEEELVR